MNLASALIKQVLKLEDFDTWISVRKHYLPSDYHTIFDIISKHSETYHKLPSIEELKFEIRDPNTLEKIYAIDLLEVDTEPYLLLDYLKNEFAQKEVLYQIDSWIDKSIAFETAEEVVKTFQDIGQRLEERVEIQKPEENMQTINLFYSEEEVGSRITLGFNKDFDDRLDFRATDLIMMGGKRGSGKSITCSNISNHLVETKKQKVLYFSIEMEAIEILQRSCAIATEVPFIKIRNKNLDIIQWEIICKWWASRYQDSDAHYQNYLDHRSFDRFHKALSKEALSEAFVDIVYDKRLTLAKFNAEIDKRLSKGEKIAGCVLDYVNQVKLTSGGWDKQFDWKDQIIVAKHLKETTQETKIPCFSPYQTDSTGEARFAKGLLDSADAAFTLDPHSHSDNRMTFKTTKMRGASDEEEFTSVVNWSTLKIGPGSAEPIVKEEKHSSKGKKSGEGIYDDGKDPPF